MTDNTTPTVPEEQLHRMLSDLVAEGEANGGQLNEDSFWRLVAAIAQGRGVTERLHAAGLDAEGYVPPSPRKSHIVRKQRSYHAGLLRHLLMGIGREAQGQPDPVKRDGASILPGNFNTGVVAADLLSMQEGQPLAKPGRGQLLAPPKGGDDNIREFARYMVVGAVLYRAARYGLSKQKVRNTLEPFLEKSTWDNWLRKFGGPNGALAQKAEAEAAQGSASEFDMPDKRLSELLRIAFSGQGGRTVE